MLIKHGHPFSIVEEEFFQIFFNNLQPSFRLVSRNTIKNYVMKIYLDEKELYKYFDGLDCRISLTTDMWTSEQNLGCELRKAHGQLKEMESPLIFLKEMGPHFQI
uniref:Zinc finger BED domain-containing protein DAYSLEEPER-like n=1 Tax=Nelumbo nucifera TaxID=4432 RepID=A0A822XRS3_NELNU|nr:TPA_asm: hypothetical protein HUJ06_024185 [Nelumbo nucifera]